MFKIIWGDRGAEGAEGVEFGKGYSLHKGLGSFEGAMPLPRKKLNIFIKFVDSGAFQDYFPVYSTSLNEVCLETTNIIKHETQVHSDSWVYKIHSQKFSHHFCSVAVQSFTLTHLGVCLL